MRVALALLAALLPMVVQAATLRVPEDSGTIQAAVDASASGDTVLVAPGTYRSELHVVQTCGIVRSISSVLVAKPGVVVRSSRGAAATVLEGVSDGTTVVKTVLLANVEGAPAILEGFTITGSGVGVSVHCSSSGVELRDCRIVGNPDEGLVSVQANTSVVRCTFKGNGGSNGAIAASGGGLMVRASDFVANLNGAMWLWELAHATVETCGFYQHTGARAVLVGGVEDFDVIESVFLSNHASESGAAVRVDASIGSIENCLFADCATSDAVGGAIQAIGSSDLQLRGNTFYQCRSALVGGAVVWAIQSGSVSNNVLVDCGAGALAAGQSAAMTESGCNLVWQADDPYFQWPESAQAGDLLVDPQLCDPEAGDFTLHSTSPAAAQNSPSCGQIGALGVGCGTVSVEPMSFGRIKSRYRRSDRP